MAPLRVLSTLAFKGVFDDIAPRLERALDLGVSVHIDATVALLHLLEKGEPADVVFLTATGIDKLRLQRYYLARSGIGVAVRAGAPKPDITTVDAFKHALRSARSVARSKVGASGLYLEELLPRLELKIENLVIVERGPVGEVVAAGGAELGVQQLCELAPVPGIDIVGPFPDAIQKFTTFSAGVPRDSRDPSAARRLIALVAKEKAAMLKSGMEPL
jgi:molybdate transport system substrate-binding protein